VLGFILAKERVGSLHLFVANACTGTAAIDGDGDENELL